MTGICETHPANLSSASQWRALKLPRVQFIGRVHEFIGPNSSESEALSYIKYPPIRRKGCPVPPGWVQDNREKTGEFMWWCPGDGGRESENCSLSMASSSASELQATASRRKEAPRIARQGRTADSRSKTVSLACRVLSVKFSQYLQFEMTKIGSRAWARPTHLTHLPCWSSLEDGTREGLCQTRMT